MAKKDIKPEDSQCPVCGYYCLGKGGHGCIDKPTLCGIGSTSETEDLRTTITRLEGEVDKWERRAEVMADLYEKSEARVKELEVDVQCRTCNSHNLKKRINAEADNKRYREAFVEALECDWMTDVDDMNPEVYERLQALKKSILDTDKGGA